MGGYEIGRLIGLLAVPVLILVLLGVIQYLRTRDRTRVLHLLVSWWVLALAAVCLVMGIVAQFVERIP